MPDESPPAAKKTPAKKAAAPPVSAADPFTPEQRTRVAALQEAKDLLDRDCTARELLDLARHIEGGDDDHDDGEPLTFTRPTTTEGAHA